MHRAHAGADSYPGKFIPTEEHLRLGACQQRSQAKRCAVSSQTRQEDTHVFTDADGAALYGTTLQGSDGAGPLLSSGPLANAAGTRKEAFVIQTKLI